MLLNSFFFGLCYFGFVCNGAREEEPTDMQPIVIEAQQIEQTRSCSSQGGMCLFQEDCRLRHSDRNLCTQTGDGVVCCFQGTRCRHFGGECQKNSTCSDTSDNEECDSFIPCPKGVPLPHEVPVDCPRESCCIYV